MAMALFFFLFFSVSPAPLLFLSVSVCVCLVGVAPPSLSWFLIGAHPTHLFTCCTAEIHPVCSALQYKTPAHLSYPRQIIASVVSVQTDASLELCVQVEFCLLFFVEECNPVFFLLQDPFLSSCLPQLTASCLVLHHSSPVYI